MLRNLRTTCTAVVVLCFMIPLGIPTQLAAAAPLDSALIPTERAALLQPLAMIDSVQHGLDVSQLEQVRALAELKAEQLEAQALAAHSNKRLDFDPSLIASVGNQLADGHMVCCPGYACAYGDVILTGQAQSHANYGCGCCTWPGWGGGNSSFRSLGSDTALLREAYDEIAAGRPTIVHVMGAYNEHWICLMGYQGVEDPDNLTLDNFLALDPVDGAEIVASERYTLYGDACEHISERR